MEKIHIGCASNSRFAIPTATMVYSAIRNARSDTRLVFHVIDGGLTRADKNLFSRALASAPKNALTSARFSPPAGASENAALGSDLDGALGTRSGGHEVHWHPIDPSSLSGLPERAALPRETYLRLMAPELLPVDLSRLLWLDGDTLIEQDLTSLWETDLGNCSTGAVCEYGASRLADVAGTAQTYERLKLDGNAPYLNAGVILMDLVAWRSQGVANAVFSYIEEFRETIRYGDQDGLNAVLVGKWVPLDRRWNVQISALRYWEGQPPDRQPAWFRAEAAQLKSQPGIIHFTDSKPWEAGMFSRFRSRYFYYLRRSGMMSPIEYVHYRATTTWNSAKIFLSRRLTKSRSASAIKP